MKQRNTPSIIIVAGPTSSGKSDLAIQLARKFNGEIISADSRQVYRGMDIGTGKVTKAEQKLAQHWLLDVVSPKRQYSVAQWKTAAQKIITDIIKRGKLPIICGGTGFWIDALVYDINLPEVQPNPRLRKKLEQQTTDQLFASLKQRDPRRAKMIDRHNRRRLIRALEIVMVTGAPVPQQRNGSPYEPFYLVVSRPLDELKERIERRLDARLRRGMVAEIKKLHADGVSWQRLENFGLEYRWVSRFLQDKISKTEMREKLLHDIIGYAKRQLTWWKRNKTVHLVKNQNEAVGFVRKTHFLNAI